MSEFPAVPDHTPEDLARDAGRDYAMAKAGWNEWDMSWIRRAEYYRKQAKAADKNCRLIEADRDRLLERIGFAEKDTTAAEERAKAAEAERDRNLQTIDEVSHDAAALKEERDRLLVALAERVRAGMLEE